VKIADFGLSRSLAITREANKRGSMTDLASLAKRVRRLVRFDLLAGMPYLWVLHRPRHHQGA